MRLVCSAVLLTLACVAGLAAQVPQVPNPYQINPDWGELPAGFHWGEVIGVEVDSTGNIYVLQRCSNGEGNGNGTCAGRSEPPVATRCS